MPEPAPFESLDAYLELPRVAGLVAAPDRSRLVATVQTLSADRTEHRSSLWEIDPDGGPARRLTWSDEGERAPALLPGGDLLFVSERPAPGADDGGKRARLWLLPAAGGDPQVVVDRAGGVSGALVAARSGSVVLTAPALDGPAAGDDGRRSARKQAGVSAVLFEQLPVRHWDHDLGPDHPHLFATRPASSGPWGLEDLTPDPGSALEEADAAVSADGRMLYTGWRVGAANARERWQLVGIDTATAERTVLATDDRQSREEHEYSSPAVAPDGSWLAVLDTRVGTPEVAPTTTLVLVDLATGQRRNLLPGFDLWPAHPVASVDSRAVFFVADQAGHVPVFRVDVESGEVTRLSRSGAYSSLCPSADGRYLFALRSHIDSPPRPVRLEATGADQQPVVLDAPGDVGALPGRVEDVSAVAPDGARVRAWLVLPDAERPAPLALWVHGGPLMSWDSWSWRWNPWLLAARGWAVLLPDPGLSQGYGDEFVQRAWGQWGPVPFADLMAVTDEVAARPDIDAARTAAMGGSYGGYMANWIAGHTDRFSAIVTHASLWTLDRFVVTTDHPGYWADEWGWADAEPERYTRNSPHLHADAITTPMLVVHGDKDYRVPIGEGLALWTDLVRRGIPAKFLYFPDEGHWVTKPGNAKTWYETVLAFLDHHVLGEGWKPPDLL
jgi:dipeptidyl aminopeptidase/acylaminoacyl peptidase